MIPKVSQDSFIPPSFPKAWENYSVDFGNLPDFRTLRVGLPGIEPGSHDPQPCILTVVLQPVVAVYFSSFKDTP